MYFANIVPKQVKAIPWGWINETHECDTPGLPKKITFVKEHPGRIEMPTDLITYFDWSTYTIEDFKTWKTWGTQNFKSIFTTASRFLGYEKLLAERPSLDPILDEFYKWNQRLLTDFSDITEFMIGDDIAGNNGLFMSLDHFNTWLLPYYRPLIQLARDFGASPAFHSDGDIYDILPFLASVGFKTISYQPIGRMACFADGADCLGMTMYKVEDWARENEETLRLQR